MEKSESRAAVIQDELDRFELNLDIEENVDCEDLSVEGDMEGLISCHHREQECFLFFGFHCTMKQTILSIPKSALTYYSIYRIHLSPNALAVLQRK